MLPACARTRSSYDAPSDKKDQKADKTLPLITPVERLEPGAYLLRFEASGAGTSVTRDVRFVVR